MVSPKQSEVNKNKILDWLKEDQLPFTELDKKPEHIDWAIAVGKNNVIVNAVKALPDRVIIQAAIVFTEEQLKLLHKDWSPAKLASLRLKIFSSLTSFNVRPYIFEDKEKRMAGLQLSLFLINSLNKETFETSFHRIEEVLLVTLGQLSATIGVELQALKDQQKESSFNPLAT